MKRSLRGLLYAPLIALASLSSPYISDATINPTPTLRSITKSTIKPTEEKKDILYTTKKGDSLWSVAKATCDSGKRYEEIKSLNSLISNNIRPGLELKLPQDCHVELIEKPLEDSKSFGYYTVKRHDTLSKIGQKLKVNYQDIASDNSLQNINRIYPGQKLKVRGLETTIADKVATPRQTKQKEEPVPKLKMAYEFDIKATAPLNTGGTLEISSTNTLDHCYLTTLKLKRAERLESLAKKLNLKPQELAEQFESRPKIIPSGEYKLCAKPDQSTGYIFGHYDYNWSVASMKTPKELWKERNRFKGDLRKKVAQYGEIFGINPGSCFVKGNESWELLAEKMPIIKEVAANHSNVSEDLVAAIIKHETGGNSKCFSRTGAYGLMGLTSYIYMADTTWENKTLKPSNPMVDRENINAGTTSLSILLEKYKGDIHLALTAYNQGEDRVNLAIKFAKKRGITNSYDIVRKFMPTAEGRAYSRKILAELKEIRREKKMLLASL